MSLDADEYRSPARKPEFGASLPRPSVGLLTAALAGLLSAGIAGCDEDEKDSPIVDCENPTGIVPPPDAGVTNAAPSQMDAGLSPHTPGTSGDAGPITTVETKGFRAWSSLKAECDKRGGYMQVHAACAGANNCRGFSYHSGTPGTYTEHTCASANGCTGASCVDLAKKPVVRTGKEIYEDETLPQGGPANCGNCHAGWTKDAMGNYVGDFTKFRVWELPGQNRFANWRMITAAEQESIVAFGKVGVMPDGTAQVSMRGYHQILSRDEIKKVVEYIRSGALTLERAELKTPGEVPVME